MACAAALTTVELLEGGLIDNAVARGAQGLAALESMAKAYMLQASTRRLLRELAGKL